VIQYKAEAVFSESYGRVVRPPESRAVVFAPDIGVHSSVSVIELGRMFQEILAKVKRRGIQLLPPSCEGAKSGIG
jgi:hypothetical protein